MFVTEFSREKITCLIENIFEDKGWAIFEWKDPLGMRGCGFFQFENGKIIFQRGYGLRWNSRGRLILYYYRSPLRYILKQFNNVVVPESYTAT